MNVQASEPANLATAITAARRWETGKLLAYNSASTTDKAIEHLTEQLNRLNINLLEKQTTPYSKPIYYADNNSDNRTSNQPRDMTCYYCGYKGHFIRDCHMRKDDQRRESSRRDSRSYNNNNRSYDRSRSRNQNNSCDRYSLNNRNRRSNNYDRS